MRSHIFISWAVAATLAVPALCATAAAGDKYDVTTPNGRKFAVITVTGVREGIVKYTHGQLDDLVEALDRSLSEEYGHEGSSEFEGSTNIVGHGKLEASFDTTGSHSSLKECFTEEQWQYVVDQFIGAVLGGNEEPHKSPEQLGIAVQNVNGAGHVVGPCRDDHSDCIGILEHIRRTTK